MKPLFITVSTVLLCVFVMVAVQDMKQNEIQNYKLRYVTEELSVTGTLFFDRYEYSQGRKVFNQVESLEAMEHQIKDLLRLDDDLNPFNDSYWTERVSYEVYFFDDSNTVYPYLFTDDDTLFTFVVTQPACIVTVNAGKGRYRIPMFQNSGDNIRSAAHEWKSR